MACLCKINSVWADDYQRVELQYRDAVSIIKVLTPLLPEGVAVSSDGMHILVRAPNEDIKNLVKLIQSLDKPLKQWQVWVYRGHNPHIHSNKFANPKPTAAETWSTESGNNNRSDYAVVAEGSSLFITDSNLIAVEQERYRAVGNVREETEATRVAQYNDRYERKRYQAFATGIQMTPTLLADGRLSIATVIDTQDAVHSKSTEPTPALAATSITRIVPLGEWVLLSQSQQVSNRPPLDSPRQVFSTKMPGNFDRTIWVKFQEAN